MTRQGDDPHHADEADDHLLDRLYVPDGSDPRDGASSGESTPAEATGSSTDAASGAAGEDPGERAVLGFSRRRLLQTVGAVGTVGVFGGIGTAALLGDEEQFPTAFASGNFDLSLFCPPGEPCAVDGDSVHVDVSGIQPGDAGDAAIGVALDDNPGWLWLGGPCATGKLDRVLEVSLSLCTEQDCSDGGTTVVEGTLADVLDALSSGVRVGSDCLPAKEARYLNVEWSFPSDVEKPQRYGNETASFELEFYANQCRHDAGVTNPVPQRDCDDRIKRYGISYVEVWVDIDGTCTPLGKYELDDSGGTLDVGATYPLSETYDGFDGDYAIRITDTVEKDGGEVVAVQFKLLDDGSTGPDLCAAVVKGGQPTVTYSDEALFDGNATTELLYAPVNGNGGSQ